jgi:hypothetical protein
MSGCDLFSTKSTALQRGQLIKLWSRKFWISGSVFGLGLMLYRTLPEELRILESKRSLWVT